VAKEPGEPAVTEAVNAYLADLDSSGAQKPLASVARLLAESLEAAPEYARARLAKELREILTELDRQAAWGNEVAERREARRQQSAWVRDG
jgi:hypothetical protein